MSLFVLEIVSFSFVIVLARFQDGPLNLDIQLHNSSYTNGRVNSHSVFDNDPGFHFKLRLVSNITSELQVTAVSELDGVRVICATGGITNEFIIQN